MPQTVFYLQFLTILIILKICKSKICDLKCSPKKRLRNIAHPLYFALDTDCCNRSRGYAWSKRFEPRKWTAISKFSKQVLQRTISDLVYFLKVLDLPPDINPSNQHAFTFLSLLLAVNHARHTFCLLSLRLFHPFDVHITGNLSSWEASCKLHPSPSRHPLSHPSSLRLFGIDTSCTSVSQQSVVHTAPLKYVSLLMDSQV